MICSYYSTFSAVYSTKSLQLDLWASFVILSILPKKSSVQLDWFFSQIQYRAKYSKVLSSSLYNQPLNICYEVN